MGQKLITGAYAAVITPRNSAGELDERLLGRLIDFLLDRGVRGFAFNGATGEYCLTSTDDLYRILDIAVNTIGNRAEFVCGVGAADFRGCIEKGKVALEAGAKALLLPMPSFFVYGQEDLYVFCRAVTERLPGPILLYNLPQFTNGLTVSTVQALIADCHNIIGIKDSSGSLEILRTLTKDERHACRILGNDRVLPQAIDEQIIDGVISGVAGILPELILPLLDRETEQFDETVRVLGEFVNKVESIPVPWALKWIAETRLGVPVAMTQPVSSHRAEEAKALQHWVNEILATL